MSTPRTDSPARTIAALGIMVALLEVSKRALDSLPNVELITFWFIMFTLFYGKKVILAAFAFTGIEMSFWLPVFPGLPVHRGPVHDVHLVDCRDSV